MNLAVLVPGALLAVVGIAFVWVPARYMSVAETLVSRRDAKVIAGTIRLVFGAFLLAGAETARHSTALMILGGLFVVAGLTVLLPPRSRFDSPARWALGLSSGVVRFASAVAVVLSGLAHARRERLES